MLPWVPTSSSASPRTASPREIYSTIREEDEEDVRGGDDGEQQTSASGPSSSSSWTVSSSSTMSKVIQNWYHQGKTSSSEASPLILSSKSSSQKPTINNNGDSSKIILTKKQEKQYLKRYLQDLEQEEKQTYKDQFHHHQEPLSSSLSFSLMNCGCHSDTTWIKGLASQIEVFLANMPLTIGAMGLSWVTLGVIWFKFMEEMTDACTPVHYHDKSQCTFPEFPGCFACDTTAPVYRIALMWHYFCHTVAGTCCALFFLKVLTGRQLVVDELKNPATSTPMGVVCITMVCVFAGRFGWIGRAIVVGTSAGHVMLAFWFLYQAVVVYRLYPDPGWFPNTVGLAYAAVKTWLYFPIIGYAILILCFLLFLNLYAITLYRVARNDKIALPVCFIQLSAPSITMYAITLWAQSFPGQDIILNADPVKMATFVDLHRRFYLPVQHFMLILSLLGMVSIVHALLVRWHSFMAKEFSPAHVALVFPILSHTNAIQAYRSGINAYSNIPDGHWYKQAIFVYWVTCLLGGSIFCFVMTYHYVIRLPRWTNFSLGTRRTTGDYDNDDDGEELLSPIAIDNFSWMGNYMGGDQASLPSALTDAWSTGEGGGWELLDDMDDAVNPAVLQANETGVMVRVRRGTVDWEKFGPYKRTRQVPSMGFDLTLTEAELNHERARHRIHRRANSMAIPQSLQTRHVRSRTMA
eukprot:scaffold2103_cov185-Amphora_coffeaeformis.AAC.37